MLKKHLFISMILMVSTIYIYAGDEQIKPVFPEGSSGLIYIEGENAVSTNFANQAVSNFGCSGYKSVQLNRNTGLQGGAAFFAEFVFYVEEAGDYEFWYGGTPPGPSDEILPSYASPFRYILDGVEAVPVYRENVEVIDSYTPAYYWNKCGSLNLSEGAHRFRIEVAEKRAYDNRYYFYLDSLFFLNKEKAGEIDEIKPVFFPAVFEESKIDNPFLSIKEYEDYISNNSDEMSAYIELSLVYSLIGDYQSALKTLNRAMLLDAGAVYPVVLAAKNRLWKGDRHESFALYDRALKIDPENKMLWAEAGKVAAWAAEYERAIGFFKGGLERFPDDLNLRFNLALTYLWMSRNDDAQKILAEAMEAADEPDKLSELGWVEEVNGYPEYARSVYERGIDEYPEYLEFYLRLQASYLSSGDKEAADEVGRRIESTFIPSPKLSSELETYKKKLKLRDEVIDSYIERLKNEPDNLELRQELAQTYFWNGMSGQAIEQIKYVITTHSYRAAKTWFDRNGSLLELMDNTASVAPFYDSWSSAAAAARKAVEKSMSKLASARKAADDSRISEAEQSLADAVMAAQNLASRTEKRIADVDAYAEAVRGLLVEEKSKDQAFSEITGLSGWRWNKDWQIVELKEIKAVEPELATYMLTLVLDSEGLYDQAAGVLIPETGKSQKAEDEEVLFSNYDFSGLSTDMLYLLYQALLLDESDFAARRRSALFEIEGERLTEAFPHIAEVEKRLLDADKPASGDAAGIYFNGLELEASRVIEALAGYSERVEADRNRVDLLKKQLAAIAEKELERANYSLEYETYLIRYELGTYYLDEGMNFEAAEQFRRVIVVDPWNISATYKLGVVEQRYGNWSEAMKYYKKVYYQDSNYENTVYYYNQLARAHADSLASVVQMTAGPQEIGLTANLDYKTEFNSILGLNVGYSLKQKRRYRAFKNEQTGWYQLHLVEASLPVVFGKFGLTIKPLAGLYAESIYFKENLYFPEDDDVIPAEFLRTISTYPRYGFAAEWKWNFLTVNASWAKAREEETSYAGRKLLGKDDIQLKADTWIDFDEEFLGPLTTRTYGRLQFMKDSNIKGQIFQDVMLGFNLSNTPIIRLSPMASFNFENSIMSPAEGYYAPDKVIEAKGGLRSSFTFPSSDWSAAFEAVLWVNGGGYWSHIGEQSLLASAKVEGGLGLTFVKNSNIYYLNISSSGAFSDNPNDYWEMALSLGVSLKMPGLLTP